MPVKRIICLANSRKLNGRCIAGIEIRENELVWVRPVSAREHEEVSEHERHYSDGSDPRVLDILDVPLLEHRPHTFQQENWLLDPAHHWQFQARTGPERLVELIEAPGPLWLNGTSTIHGLHDQIPVEQAAKLVSSLKLIQVPDLRLRVFAPGAAFGNTKRRVQGRFTYAGVEYALWVTDPVVERQYLALQEEEHTVGTAFLTVSLGEPFNNHTQKLIAAVIIP
jgi:hypothetical protein